MGHPATHERRAVCFGECMLELQGPAFGTLRQGYGGDTLPVGCRWRMPLRWVTTS
jgi:hypothetical protein